jgi:hypothetical protein
MSSQINEIHRAPTSEELKEFEFIQVLNEGNKLKMVLSLKN